MNLKVNKLQILLLLFLLLSGRSIAQLALEPQEVALGARVQGMGRAFLAAPAEPDSLFLNPASLSGISSRAATSMYAKFQRLSDYYLVGAVSPVKYGAVGIGYISTLVNGIYRDPVKGTIALQPGGSQKLFNDLLLCAYGREIDPNFSLGLSFKAFNKGLVGAPGAGSGFDADFGLLYKYNPNLSLGFMQRNLFAALGSTILWSDGLNEVIPNATRIGVNYNQPDLNVGADCEFYPGSTKRLLVMVGGEWWPIPEFAMRLGLDQDQISINNFSLGLTYVASTGLKIDYAYHQYAHPKDDTNFISFSFPFSRKIFPEAGAAAPKISAQLKSEIIKLSKSFDRTVTFDEMITIEGSVSAEALEVLISGKKAPLQDGHFRSQITLFPGKNLITISALGNKEKLLEENRIRILNLVKFSDVPDDHWARYPVALMSMLNLMPGYRDGTFRPESNLTRQEVFNLLLNLSDLGAPFPLILPNQALSQPDDLVTRADAVSIIAKFAKLPIIRINQAPFTDVPGRYWAAEEIASAKGAGWLNFLRSDKFAPEKKITRAELCHLVSRINPVTAKIYGLLDFENGYSD